MLCSNEKQTTLLLKVGGRTSPLSKIQVQEVQDELHKHHPHVRFEPFYVETTGDQDQKTSLRNLDKTDFFTKEIDSMVLQGKCRIGIHSAKDLPSPLPPGLELICLTKGIDPSDSLVLRKGYTLDSLPEGAVIATSSIRREEAVKTMRSDLTFKDLRGTIGMRLAQMDRGEADGIVVAEAALIRLGLTHLNRVRIPGETTEGQGQLAILAKAGDIEMRELFSCMNTYLNANV